MSTVYTKLADMLQGETPYRFGRMLYKYTDCGPWVSFIVPDKPERIEQASIEIRKPKAGPYLIAKSRTRDTAIDALQFCGFDAYGNNQSRWSSLNAYYKRVDQFRESEPKPGATRDWMITSLLRCIGCVRIELERTVKATTKDIYYEDPNASTTGWIDTCIGIEVGSIVEGSDNGPESEVLMFPFTEEEFDAAVARIDKECGIIWEWANVTRDKLGRKHAYGKTDAERGLDWPLL